MSEDVTRWQTFTVDFACYVASVTGTFYWQRVANAYQVLINNNNIVINAYQVLINNNNDDDKNNHPLPSVSPMPLRFVSQLSDFGCPPPPPERQHLEYGVTI